MGGGGGDTHPSSSLDKDAGGWSIGNPQGSLVVACTLFFLNYSLFLMHVFIRVPRSAGSF